MSNPQAQGSQGPGQGQQQPSMLKAEDLAKLQSLNEDQKQKYRPVLQNFWAMLQNKPQGSVEYQTARAKLSEWSARLINQERQYRRQRQISQTAGQAQQAQPPPQAQQPASQLDTQASPPAPQVAQQQSQPQQQQQQPGARPQGQQQINPEIIKHVQNFSYHLPPSGPKAGTPEGDKMLKEFRNSYLMALNKQEKCTHRVKGYAGLIETRTKTGQEVPQDLLSQKSQAEQEYANAKKYVEEFRRRQQQYRQENEQLRMQQQQQQQQEQAQAPPPQPPPPSQQQQQPQAQPSQPPQAQIKQEPQIKMEGGGQAQPPQQFGGAQQQPQAAQGVVAQQPGRQPSQAQMPQNQPQQFSQPGQPPRPQINPQQANAHQQQQTNSPHPQSATSNAGQPVPLSHQAAVSAAQRSYSNTDPQRTTTPMQQHGQGSFHQPGSREREQLNNPKMPIPRTLNVTAPQPVSLGQARPTMSGPTNGAPGSMGQPVITKFPQFQLEGEGERLLSKRKLDELVRQVTAGGEDALTPEVEEVVLQLADDFIDNVLTNACKLAKLRESPTLDIRDIQLVLERGYNIRIPGFASDEVRTVRKLVPAPGWTQKMNAVQAAKVMGGKTDI
ncbi:hypothetical protein EJ04DRAFT_310471 [Polyplosphaeria fusca]|uniref:Transcription initiation factor TFIID subunit 12 domain-containing protein n=1 Tax=Polyplosphaeria fusca TaxID=682080 RepID=A0A9P4V4B9_9PLEO|nr:hypothetical protein EJ04DRAFT_310471 [Polyplosphaeria fusca]